MTVLQLIDSLDAGGAERVAVTYANALVPEIDQSSLCVTRKEGILKKTIDGRVNYLFLNKKHTLDILALIRLIRFIQKHQITIIHAHSSSYFTATLMKLINSKLKLIWHDHYGNSEMLEHRKFKVLRWCSKKFSRILCVNRDLEEWANRNLKTKKVHYFRNAVSFPSEMNDMSIKLEGQKGKRIVCLANFRPQKDHENLLEAFKQVVQKYSDFSLHLFGKNWNDSYFRKINELMIQDELKSNVFYYGSNTNVAQILQHMDMGVLASKSEGLPMTLLEYGMAGLGVVCTDVGQCKDVIHGYGACVQPNKPDELANSIIRYIDHPDKMKQNALSFQAHIEQNYSMKVLIPELVSYYEA
jgi:glycosyltransferase involved in cell wall biosynthesis